MRACARAGKGGACAHTCGSAANSGPVLHLWQTACIAKCNCELNLWPPTHNPQVSMLQASLSGLQATKEALQQESEALRVRAFAAALQQQQQPMKHTYFVGCMHASTPPPHIALYNAHAHARAPAGPAV